MVKQSFLHACAIVTLTALPVMRVQAAQKTQTLTSLRELLTNGAAAHKEIRLETMPVPASLAVEAEKARTLSLKWISITESSLDGYRKQCSLANEYLLVTHVRETGAAVEALADLLGKVATHESLYEENRPLIYSERALDWVEAVRALGTTLSQLHMTADEAFYDRLLALER